MTNEVMLVPPQEDEANLGQWRNYEYGSVRDRWLAGVVDWSVAMVWSGLVVVTFFAPGWFGNYSFDANLGTGLIAYFGLPIARGVVILRHFLNALRVMKLGDTFGHRLLGLSVVRVDGGRIGWRRALARQFLGSPVLWGYFSPLLWALIAFVINQLGGSDANSDRLPDVFEEARWHWLRWGSIALVVVAGLHHLAMVIDRKGRGLHDRLIGTIVVKYE